MEHRIHPGHPLAEVYGSEEFQCDGCKIPGSGPRYRCHTCDFNLHSYCGRCPSTLSTFMHPQHQLELVIGAQARRCFLKKRIFFFKKNESFCDLCGDNVEGLFYRCKLCDFNIHPLCTKLPEYVPHVLHPADHQLKLHKTSSPGWCRVCKSECTSWRYGCRSCSFDIHLECILARCDDASSTPSRSVVPRGWGWGWGWGQTHSHHGAYNGPPTHSHYGAACGLQYYPPYCSSTPPPISYPSAPSPTQFGAYVHPSPTHFAVHAHPYAFAPPPPPPSYGAYAHGEHPAFIPHNANHSVTVSEPQGNGKPSKWRKRLGRIIFSLVTNLTAGLLSGVIFGT